MIHLPYVANVQDSFIGFIGEVSFALFLSRLQCLNPRPGSTAIATKSNKLLDLSVSGLNPRPGSTAIAAIPRRVARRKARRSQPTTEAQLPLQLYPLDTRCKLAELPLCEAHLKSDRRSYLPTHQPIEQSEAPCSRIHHYAPCNCQQEIISH